MTLANALTLLRLLLVPFLVYLLHGEAFGGALALFALAGLSDAADGFVAKRFGQESRLGAVLDPIADKALVVTLYVTLTWLGWVPFWLVLAVVARDAIIVTGALEMAPTGLSRVNTAFQLGFLAFVLLDAATGGGMAGIRAVLALLVLGTTVASGLQYVVLWLRKAVRYERGRGA